MIEPDGSSRPSSQAFSNTTGTDSMSVDLARLRGGPHEAIVGRPSDELVSLMAGYLGHDLHQDVEHAPVPGNPAHSSVRDAKSKSVKHHMALASTIVIARR